MAVILTKATGIWLLLMVAAVINGIVRDVLLYPLLGAYALPASGVLLSLLVFVITFLLAPLMGTQSGRTWIMIGLLWVIMTLCFEYLFAYLVMDRTWGEIGQVFNPASGNLFLLALISALLSPRLAAGLRGLVDTPGVAHHRTDTGG